MLADNLNKIASNFSGTRQDFNGPSASFVSFVRERATEMAINGSKGMGLSLNHSLWGLEAVENSLFLLRQDGFDAKLVQHLTPMVNGEEGIEYILTVEWK